MSALENNLFIHLAEKVAQELGITNCWVCGGALTSERWPWRGTGLDALQILQWNRTINRQAYLELDSVHSDNG